MIVNKMTTGQCKTGHDFNHKSFKPQNTNILTIFVSVVESIIDNQEAFNI